MSDGHSNQPDTTNTSITHESAQPRRFRDQFPRLFLTPSPTIPTLAEQCAARGEPVPVGETARAIRDRGYVVSPIVPDETPLILSEEGSRVDTTSTGKFTGYAFRVHVRDYAHRVVRSSGALKHASHHEIERLFERIAE